jgi:RND family efflux transporter MFP subunit
MSTRINWLWLFVFIGLGVAVILIGSKFKSHPEKTQTEEFATKAKVIPVPKLQLKINATGYGHVKAADRWEAVAEVPGKVVYKSAQLKDGEFITEETELLRIDPSSYELAFSQIEAQIKASMIKDETTRLSIKTRSEEVELLQKEYDRQLNLSKKGNVSRTTVDTTHRNLLNARSNLITLENNLKINQAEREVLKIQREQALQDSNKTLIKAPMDVRITEVLISESQYANRGQKLFTADSTDAVEIEFQFPVGRLRPLVMTSLSTDESQADNWVPGVVGLQANISLEHGDHKAIWPAVINRVSASINPQTQTLGVVARVEKPYEAAQAGKKPPLISDMFVRVEILGRNSKKFMVIPDKAVHEGNVYVMNDENRLEIRPIKIYFRQKGYVAIKKGLNPKEKVVTSDLVPAIEGMLLKPMKDNKIMKHLLIDALGEIPQEFKEKMSQGKKGS